MKEIEGMKIIPNPATLTNELLGGGIYRVVYHLHIVVFSSPTVISSL